MLNQITQLLSERTDWNCLSAPHSLSELVVAAWQVGIEIARRLVESQLEALGQAPSRWTKCSGCGTSLVSKGFAQRQMLTLLGSVSWQRRVGRCRRGCNSSSGCIPLDTQLGIESHQQSSTELHRLGSLLAVYLPYDTAAQLLKHLVGIPLSAQTLWQWVQQAGLALEEPAVPLDEVAAAVESVAAEALAPDIAQLPLVIGADGITVPFRSQAGTPCGAVVGREVKVGVIAHLEQQVREADKVTHRLHQRRLVAHLGALEPFAEKLKQEALRQGLFNATLAAWISDGAKGLWRVYQEQFEEFAVGILDFYHAVEHLAQAAQVDPCGRQGRTPDQWFKRLRHQLRHGFVHRILSELHQLSQYPSTPDATKVVLQRVHDYLQTHQALGRTHTFLHNLREGVGP